VGQNLDGGPSINQKSKEVKVGPGNKASIVGVLRKMGRTLRMLKCRVLISTSPTHYGKRRLSLGSNTRGRWGLSIDLGEPLRLVQFTGQSQRVRKQDPEARLKPTPFAPAMR